MRPLITLCREFINPFKALMQFMLTLVPIYWELLFAVLVTAYGSTLIFVNGMNELNDRYVAFLHRGLWEDVVVSQRSGLDFEAPWNGSGPRIKEKLGKLVCDLSYTKCVHKTIDIQSVTYRQKDISRLHGQFDVWLKSYAPEGWVPDFATQLAPGAIVLSKKLAGKWGIGGQQDLQTIEISFTIDSPPIHSTFQLAGVVDLGGRYNILFLRPQDLAALGIFARPNLIGINTPDSKAAAMKELLGSASQGDMVIETAVEKDQFAESMDQNEIQQSMQVMIGFAPVALLCLFTVILFINFHYKCRHYLKRHASEFWLLRFYGLSPAKRLCGFYLCNMGLVVAGFCLAGFAAAAGIGLMRQFGISEIMHRVDFQTWEIVLHWRVAGAVAAIILGLGAYAGVLYKKHPAY